MKINIRIIGVLFLLAALTGCIKEGLEECPANVKIYVFAEKFQNEFQDPLANVEEVFRNRIQHLRYYLYNTDGDLVDEGVTSDFNKNTRSYYTLTYPQLDPGSYSLVLVANSAKTALQGDCVKAENLWLGFPGCADTEDFFSAILPFTVESNAVHEFRVGLLRTHGVIRFKFNNLPEDAVAMEMTIQNVSSEKWILGDYMNSCHATHKYLVVTDETDENPYLMGTFPTLLDTKAIYNLKLYREGKAEPFFTQDVTDDVIITRNQLVDVVTTFDEGNVSVEVILDATWDGSIPGGDIDID